LRFRLVKYAHRRILPVPHANLSAMHRATAHQLGPRAALRFKKHGLYHDLSWLEYRLAADNAAAGLIALDVELGDRIAILSENRVEWPIADLAALSAGAIDVPMHAPLSSSQVLYQLQNSGAVGVMVSGPEQAAKVRQSLANLPDLRWLVAFDPIETTGFESLRLLSWDGLKSLGSHSPESAQEARRREPTLTRDDLATIIYTSGTTGPPKGVMLTHGNLLSNAEAGAQIAGTTADDVVLSWLPYSHIYARTCDIVMSALAGPTLCLAESIETLTANLAEIRPSCMSAVPRFYEKVWANLSALPNESRPAAVKSVFGGRVRHFSSGGAPLPKHVAIGFHEAGMTLMEGYGLTETSPIISFNTPAAFRVGSVGRAIPGVEVRISEAGEILTRGPHVMRGYWKDPAATAIAIDQGWFHTGDLGHLDEDGYLFITGRSKDLIITSGGKNVAPSEIERHLVSDPLIEQAVVFGDGRPFISALIVPDFAELANQLAKLGLSLERDGEFVTSPPIRALLADRIERTMREVSGPERVKAFLVLSRPLRVEEDELTATLKVRRSYLLAKFATALAALYESE
jgi:long-chain acyl-CoA synthetase